MCLFSLWYIHFQVLFVQVRKGFALCDSCIRQTLDFVQVFRWELADAAWWVSMECRLKVGSLFGLATAFPVDLLTVKGTNWTKTYLCSWRWKFLKLSELPPQKGKPFWDMVYIYIIYNIHIIYNIIWYILTLLQFIHPANEWVFVSLPKSARPKNFSVKANPWSKKPVEAPWAWCRSGFSWGNFCKLLGDSISTSWEIMGKSWEHLTTKISSGCRLLIFWSQLCADFVAAGSFQRLWRPDVGSWNIAARGGGVRQTETWGPILGPQ